jgi:hypothetical protein
MTVQSDVSARSVVLTGSSQPWAGAFQISLCNAAFFFVFSSINLILEVSASAVHNTAAIIFFARSMWAFYRKLLAGGALAAVSFYVCGTGLVFGFGSFYSTVTGDPVYTALFGEERQSRYFATINLMNSLSVLIALACAFLVCGTRYVGSPHQGLRGVINALQILRRPLLALAGIALFCNSSSFLFQKTWS